MAGDVAVGVLSGVPAPLFGLPSMAAHKFSDLMGDPSAYGSQDLSFSNTLPDPSALRDVTYVAYNSLRGNSE
ncbi:unnamed protein product [Citrullus colocynthis]|uniref:Uncharacterized protein n=1 Tax=Citrullus colocynthis TaxID=252529 RepID=A0ABP0Z881_9ROSI